MFERFSSPARRVIVLAQEEARMLTHNYIGTEHLLLGLVRQGDSLATQALEALGLSPDDIRAQVEDIVGQGQGPLTEHIPFTPRAKKALELSLREALQLGHTYVGPEHLLLGVIREGEGIGAQVLVMLGAELIRTRQQILQLQHPTSTTPERKIVEETTGLIAAIGEAVAAGTTYTRQYSPTEEYTISCDIPGCQAELSMVAGVPRTEHNWGRVTIYDAAAGLPWNGDYDLCVEHHRAVVAVLRGDTSS